MRGLGHPQMPPGHLSGKIFQDTTKGRCLPKCLGISLEELGEVSGHRGSGPDLHDLTPHKQQNVDGCFQNN